MSTCPSCGEINPERARFCLSCGASLAQAVAGTEARKTVTALFCDVVGSTAMGEHIDTEVLTGVMARYFDRMRAVIRRHGGTVEKFIGDAVVAVFGYPTVHEDDALRAVRAAAEMRTELLALNAELNAEAGPTLRTRTGINTGEVLVGALAPGSNFAAGDVMNTAARLQQNAEPGEILLGAGTWPLVKDAVEAEAIEPAEIKGKAERVPAWRLLDIFPGGEMFGRRLDAPLVGRGVDLALVRSALDKALQDETVQLVTIVGEPGVGKTRLVQELQGFVGADAYGSIRWRKGRCLPYGEGVTFWALGEIVKAEAGILENDPPDTAGSKIDALVSGSDADAAWLRRRLRPLVGLDAPQAGRDENFAAWRTFLESLADERPTVLVLEDLHWADDALLGFVEYVAEYAEGVPLLVVATTRPELFERAPGWASNARNAHRINLAPLAEEETARLISHLLGSAVLPSDVQDAIVDRAGGNALFAQELVRLLAERGVLTKTVTWAINPRVRLEVPPAVESVIAARLDTPPPDRKRLLQDAAVIGEVFWSGAVAQMGARSVTDVDEALHELSRKELIRPVRKSSMAGQAEYAFFHALVRDVCYEQIPRARRSERHRRAAEWIESVSGERVEDHAEILASHFVTALEVAGPNDDRARLLGKALQYLIASGDRAMGLDTAKAEASYAKALELAEDGNRQRPMVLARWGEAARARGRLSEAIPVLREAVSMLRGQGDIVAAASALTILASSAWAAGLPESVRMAAEAVDLLDGRPGPELLAAYGEMARQLGLSGNDTGSIEFADRAIALAADLGLGEPPKALGYRGAARVARGEQAGVDDMRRALRLAIDRGDGWEASVLFNNIAMDLRETEGPVAALAMWQEGRDFSERRGIDSLPMASAICGIRFMLGSWEGLGDEALDVATRLEAIGSAVSASFARAVEACVRSLQGSPERAVEVANGAAETVRRSRSRSYVAPALGAAALANALAGHRAEARSILIELSEFQGIDLRTEWLPTIVRTAVEVGDAALGGRLADRLEPVHPLQHHAFCASRATLAEARGETSAAVALYMDAADRWKRFSMPPEQAFALLGWGRCLRALGRQAEAIEPLRRAQDIFATLKAKPPSETRTLLRDAATSASVTT